MHTFTPPAPFALDKDTPQSLERDLPSEGVLSVVLEVNPASPLNAKGALSLRARNPLYALEAPEILVQSVLNNLEDAQRSTRTRAYFLWEEHGHVKALLVAAQLELPELRVRYGLQARFLRLEQTHFSRPSWAVWRGFPAIESDV